MRADIGISALIITRGRHRLLEACLGSMAAAGAGVEVIVGLDGGDGCSAARLREKFSFVKVVQLPRSCRGEARNRLIALAAGRWLCFLDDDVVLPPGYFDRLRALISLRPDISVFGGGQLLSGEAGLFEAAVGASLGSTFGAGPFVERFAPVSGRREAAPGKFILCNLTADSLFLRSHGLEFEGHLTSAEENLLLGRMAAAGARMLLAEDLNLVHRRRGDLRGFSGQVFSCGRGRGQITARSARGFSAFTLLPPAALAAACASAFFAPSVLPWLAGLYAACCAVGAAASPARTPAAMFAAGALYPVLHGCYAAGWLCGLGEGLAEKAFRNERPLRCYCEENR